MVSYGQVKTRSLIVAVPPTPRCGPVNLRTAEVSCDEMLLCFASRIRQPKHSSSVSRWEQNETQGLLNTELARLARRNIVDFNLSCSFERKNFFEIMISIELYSLG